MKNRKAFSLVELFVVLAILVSLTAIGIIGFKSFKKKANIASDNTVIDALNKYASDYKEENGKVKNLSTLADYIYEEKGFDINKLKPITKNYKYGYDFANNFFMLIDEKNEFADYKGLKEDCFIFVDSQQQFNAIKTTKYNMFLQEGNFDEKVEVNCSLDVGKNDEFVTITYKNNVAARDVYFYTNGGTLVIDDNTESRIDHYSKLSALDVIKCHTQSYHEFGELVYANVKEGHIAFEEDCSVEAVHFESSGTETVGENTFDTFAPIIVSFAEGVTQPVYSRDAIAINTETGTKVCTLALPEETNNVYLTLNGVYEQVKVEEANINGEAVDNKEWVDVSDSTQKTKDAAEQISNNFINTLVVEVSGQEYEVELQINSDTREIEVKEVKKDDEVVTDTNVIDDVKEEIATNSADKVVEEAGKDAEEAKREASQVIAFIETLTELPIVTFMDVTEEFKFTAPELVTKELDALYVFKAFENETEATIMKQVLAQLNITDDKYLAKLTPSAINKIIENLPSTEANDAFKDMMARRKLYLNWTADFTISFDRAVAANSVGLAGQYDSYSPNFVGFGLPEDLAANQEVKLLGSIYEETGKEVFNMTYASICGWVQEFTCGIVNLSDANIGTTVTVSLKLYENDANGVKTGKEITATVVTYTFAR